MCPNLFFFSNGILELLYSKPGLPQRLSHLWWLAEIVFPKFLDCGQERLESVYRLLQDPQLGPDYYPMHGWRKLFQCHLVYGAAKAQLLQRHFCLWMDSKLLLQGGYKRGTSHSATLVTSLPHGYFILWVIIQYYFIYFVTKLFQLWPLGVISVGSCDPSLWSSVIF